ncbi:LysR substrate-binding domain-containing protein [Leisingera sp. ANG-M1]|uniref:LysR substrate-binding domain-containing protein n=1 Tax=Leisingera sp. ANG-M1 TaxID=1577895 RepID=UPI0009E38D59|nr:LysR substrate-binding domain-containing protein [Leisingera sp. ANG-M1]
MSENDRRFVTPPLHWLRAFAVSARHLSFTDAAEELLITQSAVSKQVRLLEQHLNQPLFLRGHRGLQLTEAGRNYLPTVVRAFSTLEQGTRSFLGYSTARNLHIKCNYAFATFWLTPHLGEFMAANPGVEMTVSTALWEQDFLESNADVEIHYGREASFGERSFSLGQEALFPVCAPEVAERLAAPEDLAGERILDLTGIGDAWDYWLQQAGLKGVQLSERQYFSTYVLSLNLAREGQGVSMGHGTLAERMIGRGELCAPFGIQVPGRDRYFAVQNHPENPHAERFLAWLLAKFEGRGTG